MPTKYLSTTGNNTNSGRLNAPWQTFDFAVKALNPGDKLIIEEGTYPSRIERDAEGAYLSHFHLSNLENIIVKPKAGAKVVVDGSIPQMSQADAWIETTDPALDFEPWIRMPNVYVSRIPLKF